MCIRDRSRVRLLIDGREAACEEGELQLVDYGISGIPVFQMSRLASRALHEGKQCEAVINFLPYIDNTEIEKAENRIFAQDMDANIQKFSYKTVEEFLSGLVHKKRLWSAGKTESHPVRRSGTQTSAKSSAVSECLQISG